MKRIEIAIDSIPACLEESCACIGYFDGVHKGHRALISKTKEMAVHLGCKNALITFYPDPYEIVHGEKRPHIQSFEERLRLIADTGIDLVYIIQFDEAAANRSHSSFSSAILKKLSLRGLVCGFDFRYGQGGKGNPEKLQEELGSSLEFSVLEEVRDEKGKISSSRIRCALQAGDIAEANHCLGYAYFVEGEVLPGRKNGRTIGFPTANIAYSSEQLLPRCGVYSACVRIEGTDYLAMVNYGVNPTVARNNIPTLEAHLFDFKGDLYGKSLRLSFIRRLRDERKFSSLDELGSQLQEDKINAMKDAVYVRTFSC